MTAQCEAVAPATTYTPEHRCLKRHGLQKVGRRVLCSHHRRAHKPRAS